MNFNRAKSEEERARWEKINDWTVRWAKITTEEEMNDNNASNTTCSGIKIEADLDSESVVSSAETEADDAMVSPEEMGHLYFMNMAEQDNLRQEINPRVDTPSTNYSDSEILSEPTSDWSWGEDTHVGIEEERLKIDQEWDKLLRNTQTLRKAWEGYDKEKKDLEKRQREFERKSANEIKEIKRMRANYKKLQLEVLDGYIDGLKDVRDTFQLLEEKYIGKQ